MSSDPTKKDRMSAAPSWSCRGIDQPPWNERPITPTPNWLTDVALATPFFAKRAVSHRHTVRIPPFGRQAISSGRTAIRWTDVARHTQQSHCHGRRGRGRAQANCALRTMAVRVLDGVGHGFSGGDEHLHRLIWVHPGSGQPAAQGGACGGEVVTGAGNFSSSGRDGDKAEDNVVLIAAAWHRSRG